MSSKTAKKPAAAAPAKVASAKPTIKAASTAKKTSAEQKRVAFRQAWSHLYQSRQRDFGIGRDIRPKTDLSRYVRWPKYVRLQRQRSVLKKRLKVPPTISQFSRTLDKNAATTLLRLLAHYRPETVQEKKQRIRAAAEAKANNQAVSTDKPFVVKFGLNHITQLVESKKAKLVVIAHDVDPIEVICWLPALCRKMNVPYCIIKSKARLGHLVHQKTVTAVALTDVRKEHQAQLDQIVQSVRLQYNDEVSHRKKWGGGLMGMKAQHVQNKRAKIAQKAALQGL